MTRICSCGRPMRITDRFLFDHEETDSPSDTESLALFGLMGIELGAKVTVWGCPVCDHTMADFDYATRFLQMVSDVKHGTRSGYDQGCRCVECRAANLRHRREARARGRAANSPTYQRELAGARARKERYRGTCEHCGAATTGADGRAAAPTVCAVCAPGVYGPRYAAERRGRGPTVTRVLDFIGDGERGYMEIVRGCGISTDHAAPLMNRLRRYGLVVRVRRGVYKKAEVADA